MPYGQAVVFAGFNPDAPTDDAVSQRQLTQFMTAYYTVTTNLDSVVTNIVTQQQQALADFATKTQQDRVAIESIFAQVTKLSSELDTTVIQNRTALEKNLTKALNDLEAKCAENSSTTKELENHLKTWAEDHEEHLKKWAEDHQAKIKDETAAQEARYAKEFTDKLDSSQRSFDNSLNKMSSLLEESRGVGPFEGGESRGHGGKGSRDRNVFDPRDYKIPELADKASVAVLRKWQHEVQTMLAPLARAGKA